MHFPARTILMQPPVIRDPGTSQKFLTQSRTAGLPKTPRDRAAASANALAAFLFLSRGQFGNSAHCPLVWNARDDAMNPPGRRTAGQWLRGCGALIVCLTLFLFAKQVRAFQEPGAGTFATPPAQSPQL